MVFFDFYTNRCAHDNCGLYFANQYDLIAHIEYVHIPILEAKRDRLIQEALARGEPPPSVEKMNLPLSCYARVFRTPYNPMPIEYRPIKISFNHYKNRPNREKQKKEEDQVQQIKNQIDPNDNRKVGEIDFTECKPGDPEMRFLCSSEGCFKRYKNIYALKAHMKSAHQMAFGDEVKQAVSPPKTLQPPLKPQSPPPTLNISTPPRLVAQQPLTLNNISSALSYNRGGITFRSRPPTPPKASDNLLKCPHCSRKYKTNVGLKNHLIQVHEKKKPSDGPSEEVVKLLIDQAKEQGKQERLQKFNEAFGKSMPPPRPLKVPVTLKVNDSGIVQQPNQGSTVTQTRLFKFTTTPQPLKLSQSPFPTHQQQQPSRPAQPQFYQFKYQPLYPQSQQNISSGLKTQNQTIVLTKVNQQPQKQQLSSNQFVKQNVEKPVQLTSLQQDFQQACQVSTPQSTSSYCQPSTSQSSNPFSQPSTSRASSSYCEPSTSQAGEPSTSQASQPSTSKMSNIRQQKYTVVYSDAQVNPSPNTQP